jgi:predicted phosphatase
VGQLPNPQGVLMDEFIARQNVAHYTQQLVTETDPIKREMLKKLLVEEKAKVNCVPPVPERAA